MTERLPIDCDATRDQAPWFVLGALDAETASAIREHLATCPEPHEEYAELGGVVPYLAVLPDQVDPPEALKARILGAAAADVRAQRRDDAAAERLVSRMGTGVPAQAATPPVAAVEGMTAEPAPLVALAEVRAARRPYLTWVLQTAAVVAIVALVAWNLALQGDVSTARERADELRGLVAAAAASGARAAHLAGQEGAPAAAGLAVFPSRGSGYLLVQGLAPAPSGRTYEAWYIVGSTPRRAGTFDVGSDGLAILSGLQPNGPVEVVAVTQEPAGGSDQPTTPVLVLGKLGA